MKSSGKYKIWEEDDQNHERSVVVLDHFRNLVDSGVQYRNWGNTYPGERKLLFEIKKRKVKNQKVVKNYYIR